MWQLSVLFLKHPLYIFPTLKATNTTFKICNGLFGNEHHKSNPANAFRHALWNVLICQKVFKETKNKQKSVFFAQKMTDLYEKVTQNEPMDEAMDLHNNAVGRICFLNNLDKNEEETINFLQKKAENAQKVVTIDEMKKLQKELVYISG